MDSLLEVKNLNIYLKKKKERIQAVSNVSFCIEKGKTLGIIGESGSGKSITSYAVMGLLDKKLWDVTGEVYMNGEPLDYKNDKIMQRIRGSRIALIMQNPMSAFNPVISIGAHFVETINKSGEEKKSNEEIKKRALELMGKMRIRDPEAVYKSYAFQLSGGMLQRIMIALALVSEPELLVADEPTTALDLTVQHEIINILHEMQNKYNTSILIVSHDLGVISHLADNIAVMYAGVFMEKGSAEKILRSPCHPYTEGLFASRPAFSKERLSIMPGQPPRLEERGKGCPFYTRCSISGSGCENYEPDEETELSGDEVRCLYKNTINKDKVGALCH